MAPKNYKLYDSKKVTNRQISLSLFDFMLLFYISA